VIRKSWLKCRSLKRSPKLLNSWNRSSLSFKSMGSATFGSLNQQVALEAVASAYLRT
jgi:hypothetical protein